MKQTEYLIIGAGIVGCSAAYLLTKEMCIRDRDTYYIYPSFKKTLAFLAQKGCAVNQTIDNLDVSSIGAVSYTHLDVYKRQLYQRLSHRRR